MVKKLCAPITSRQTLPGDLSVYTIFANEKLCGETDGKLKIKR